MSPPVPDQSQDREFYQPDDGVMESINNNYNRAFLQSTGIKNDLCSLQNQQLISSKPMKYYVNEYNSPQVNTFETYSVVGNQQVFNVRNEYERPIPSRLNPLYPVYVEPYATTPFLGTVSSDRAFVDTDSNLRWGANLRPKNSESSLGERDYNRWSPGVSGFTVQNAGQFTGGVMQQPIGKDGLYDYTAQNNVIFGNSSLPGGSTGFGISSRNILHNYQMINNC